MAAANASESRTVSTLRKAFVVCRLCKIKLREERGNGCPECGAALQVPTAPYQEAYPTVTRSQPVPETPSPGVRYPDASTGGHCIYCGVDGDAMQGEGLRKYCRDEVGCAKRVRDARAGTDEVVAPPASPPRILRPVSAGRESKTPAEVLIDVMQRNAHIDELDGPLDFSETLRLPLVAAQGRNVLFGKTGCGKTHASAVIIESLYSADVLGCALDQLGRLWGVRCAGKGGPGLPIPIIGGLHGDLPLEWTDGPKLAAIFAQGVRMLVDTSLLTLDEQADFAAGFFREILRVLRVPSHVLVEEADSLCPAFSRSKAQFAAQGAMTRFARQIRNFGVGWTLATQRQQLLHPDAVDMSNVFLAMQSTGEKSQRAIFLEARSRLGRTIADAILSEVGTLPRGEAWLMPDPSWLGGEISAPIRFRFRERRTYDSTAVPKIGEVPPRPPALVPVDLRPFKHLHDDDDAASTSSVKRSKRR